jgi:hypothetical protein
VNWLFDSVNPSNSFENKKLFPMLSRVTFAPCQLVIVLGAFWILLRKWKKNRNCIPIITNVKLKKNIK